MFTSIVVPQVVVDAQSLGLHPWINGQRPAPPSRARQSRDHPPACTAGGSWPRSLTGSGCAASGRASRRTRARGMPRLSRPSGAGGGQDLHDTVDARGRPFGLPRLSTGAASRARAASRVLRNGASPRGGRRRTRTPARANPRVEASHNPDNGRSQPPPPDPRLPRGASIPVLGGHPGETDQQGSSRNSWCGYNVGENLSR